MNEKISIYVTCHKPFIMPEVKDKDIFIPFLCGKALYDKSIKPVGDEILPEIGDDTGDNISERNPYYSELTGIYWIMKHDTDSDIIGINHYRRFFLNNKNDAIIDRRTILKNLKDYDFIVHGVGSDEEMWYDKKFSVYKGYTQMHRKKDIDNALKACKKLFPDIYEKFNYEMKNSTAFCLHNLIIARRELFMKYFSFLFSILFEVESKIDFYNEFDEGMDTYQMRVLAFLSERMFRPWMVANGYTFKNQKYDAWRFDE